MDLPLPAKLGPDPFLISRSQVEVLYVIWRRVVEALDGMQEDFDWILTGGSLLGAVRQHSILFTDDDVDIAIIGNAATYERVKAALPELLGPDFTYTSQAWEGGDRIRWKRASNAFLFVLDSNLRYGG